MTGFPRPINQTEAVLTCATSAVESFKKEIFASTHVCHRALVNKGSLSGNSVQLRCSILEVVVGVGVGGGAWTPGAPDAAREA